VTLAMWKVAPALRAGNTVVLKPSPFTPLTTLAVGTSLQSVLPPGVLNVISGSDPLGAAMCQHAVPRKISFTGSTETGKKVAAAAAPDLKRLTLELGGNDPAIVLDDADPELIAEGIFSSAFFNNGQFCGAVKRVYDPQGLYAATVEALAARAQAIKVDDGMAKGAQLGPINNRPQFDRVSGLVADAVSRGARVAAGGRAMNRPGYFYHPTILADLEDGVRIVDEEQFGPALPVVAYSDLESAIARANGTPYGLMASVWSSDPDRAADVAAQLECGVVSVNSHSGGIRPDLPFSGHKWSGVGVENGPWGLHSFTELQVRCRPR
jgi:acyl-CoA reductase-like NAD-dependent aldehyde dehydrogenase